MKKSNTFSNFFFTKKIPYLRASAEKRDSPTGALLARVAPKNLRFLCALFNNALIYIASE